MTVPKRSFIHLKTKGLTFRVNTDEIRRETIDGRAYIVAPVIAVIEGVHNDVFHPASTIEASATSWNGMPVTISHPIDEAGEWVSANDPEVSARECVGRLADMHYEDGLRGFAWLDEARLVSVSPAAYGMILAGEALEVSIGFLASGDGQSGTWGEEEYRESWQIIQPDHLALLPNDTGACSWSDGCGVRANKENQAPGREQEVGMDVNKAVDFLADCKKSGWYAARLESMFQALEAGHEEIRNGLQKIVDVWDSQTGGTRVIHWVREVYDDRFIYEARTLTENSSETHLYRLDYSVGNEEEITVGESPVEVRQKTDYPDVTRQGGAPQPQTQKKQGREDKEDEEVGDTPKVNLEKVQALIACPNTRFTKDHEEFLSGLSDCHLDLLKAIEREPEPPSTVEEYVKLAPEGLRETLEDALKTQAKVREVVAAEEKKLVDVLMEHTRNKFTREQLEAKDCEELKALAELGKVDKDYLAQAGNETNTGDEEEVPPPPDLVGAIQENAKK